MLYHKTGFPQESELVLCTVTKVQSYSVFVRLDYYENRSAMLHISEVSPGRIRNIREFVKEGKQIVCKVLSVNKEKGHIDVSLRRVPDNQKIAYMNKIKQETKAEKILEQFCEDHKLDVKKTYVEMYESIDQEFLNEAFNGYIMGEYAFETSGLSADLHAKFQAFLKERIKPPMVEIVGRFTVISYENDGIEQIRKVITKAIETDSEHLSLTYGGGGHYNVRIIHGDFKSAEKILRAVSDIMEVFKDKRQYVYEFTRSEGKQLS